MTEPALRLEGLTRRFGGVTAVDNVSVSIPKGEIVGLVGLGLICLTLVALARVLRDGGRPPRP